MPDTNTTPADKEFSWGWSIPDELWERIEPLLPKPIKEHPLGCHRKRVDNRAAMNAIFFVLRTGCQWNHLPQAYPDDSSVHRTFQRWVERGVFDQLWAVIQAVCEDLGGCNWEWQAADTAMGKARGVPAERVRGPHWSESH